MTFDKSRVYTALNADELKVGSIVYVANSLAGLKETVINESILLKHKIQAIRSENERTRFYVEDDTDWFLAYLISEPEENKLKWTDLKIGDVIRQKEGTISLLVTGIDVEPSTNVHIFARDIWVLDSELENWEKVEE